jgi:predicted phosphate transport protein (TIGR00153 family)
VTDAISLAAADPRQKNFALRKKLKLMAPAPHLSGNAKARNLGGRRPHGCRLPSLAWISPPQIERPEMFGWFHALMPREDRFFPLFEKHAAIVVAGAEALRGLLQGGDTIEEYCKQIFQREAEADEVTREVLIAVRRTFITPFDRPDIQHLITSMDDAIDQMNKTAKTIVLFEVRNFEPHMQQMSGIILQSAKLVLEAVPLLSSIGSNAGHLNALTTKLVTIEEEADDLYNRGLKELFLASRSASNQDSAMKFIIGSELYDHLEKVVDRFEDVANEINSIVVDQL